MAVVCMGLVHMKGKIMRAVCRLEAAVADKVASRIRPRCLGLDDPCFRVWAKNLFASCTAWDLEFTMISIFKHVNHVRELDLELSVASFYS